MYIYFLINALDAETVKSHTSALLDPTFWDNLQEKSITGFRSPRTGLKTSNWIERDPWDWTFYMLITDFTLLALREICNYQRKYQSWALVRMVLT